MTPAVSAFARLFVVSPGQDLLPEHAVKSPTQYIIAYHGDLASGCSQTIYSSAAFLHLGEKIIHIRYIEEHVEVTAIQCN